MRARYKVEQRKRSPFPELRLLRYECERGFDVEPDENVEKCMESHLECWQDKKG